MRIIFPALILAFGLLATTSAFAGDKVLVGLYLAGNGPVRPGTVLASEKMEYRLRAVFGFKHYKLIKAQEIALDDPWEQWVMPRRDFFIRMEPLPWRTGDTRLVDYAIYKDGFIIAKGRYEPQPDTPLFINGPDFNQGRFIFVLDAR